MNQPFSPAAIARILPFLAFMLLLGLRGALGDTGLAELDSRWVYGLSVLVVGSLLAWYWKGYGELARQSLPTFQE